MKAHIRQNQPGRAQRYISDPEASGMFGVSQRHLKFLRANRRIPYVRVGHRSIVYDVRDLEAFFAARRVEAIGAGVQA